MGLALTILMSFLPASGYDLGYDLEVDGIHYNFISSEDGTVEVARCFGSEGVLDIPSTITSNRRTLTVFRIGENAFENSEVKKVNIGNTIREIASKAFYKCKKLTSVYAPSVVEIGPNAFDGCTKLSEVVLGPDLETIGDHAFAHCESLKEINIPDNLKKFGEYCFAESGLRSFNLHKVVNIDGHNTQPILSKGLFSGCKNLTKVEGFEDLSELPDEIFSKCSKLEINDILASEKLQVIGNMAFQKCKFPSELIIKPTIKKIGYTAFGGFKGKVHILDTEEVLELGHEYFHPFFEMDISSFRLGRDLSSWDFSFGPELEEFVVGPLVTALVPPIPKSPGNPHYIGTTYGGKPFSICFNLKTVIIEPSSMVLEISGIADSHARRTSVDGETVWEVSCTGLFDECNITTLKIFRPLKSNLKTSYVRYTDNREISERHMEEAKMPFDDTFIENLSIDYDNFSYYKPKERTYLSKLYIGPHVPEIPDLNVCPLTEISVRNGEPPYAMGFNSSTYMNGKLLVPTGTGDLYKNDEIWGKFMNIEEDERLFDKITAIRLPDEEKSLAVGETVSLKPLIVPDYATIKKLSYSSSDPNVVSCNDAGELKAESIGSATITISACDGSDVSLEYKINVTE